MSNPAQATTDAYTADPSVAQSGGCTVANCLNPGQFHVVYDDGNWRQSCDYHLVDVVTRRPGAVTVSQMLRPDAGDAEVQALLKDQMLEQSKAASDAAKALSVSTDADNPDDALSPLNVESEKPDTNPIPGSLTNPPASPGSPNNNNPDGTGAGAGDSTKKDGAISLGNRMSAGTPGATANDGAVASAPGTEDNVNDAAVSQGIVFPSDATGPASSTDTTTDTSKGPKKSS